MQDPKPNKSLSEISHLFLSSIRERQTGGAPRPQRIPPGQGRPQPMTSIDLTPEEYANVFGQTDSSKKGPKITAILSAHLNGRAAERIRDYARHLTAEFDRVGVIEVDVSEFKLKCYERAASPTHSECETVVEGFDPRQMAEVLEELNWDVTRWLLVLPNARLPEARALLRDVESWTVLCTCDHDGVVSAYRTIKSLADLSKPKLSLAVLDAKDELDAGRIHRKLAGVCGQFLQWGLSTEGAVEHATGVSEHTILHCRASRDKSQMASSTQWQTVTDFISQMRSNTAEESLESRSEKHDQPVEAEEDLHATGAPTTDAHVADLVIAPVGSPAAPSEAANPRAATKVSEPAFGRDPEPVAQAAAALPRIEPMRQIESEEAAVETVVDLPGNDTSPAGITGAIIAHEAGRLVECPVRPPMCPDARLAVTRDRRVVLIAVARAGLVDLRNIGLAYRWLNENRQVLAMAVPQLSIDAHAMPHLRLIIDHADLTADLLQPMLQSASVTVQAYRKLKWGTKTGLLLEAA